MLRRLLTLGALATAAVAVFAGTGSAGVTGPAFYVDGTLYRTVGTPTDLSGTGGPASSFDTIYDFGGAQPNVATAAPGDPGFNGGRWRVHGLSFPSGYSAALAYDTRRGGSRRRRRQELRVSRDQGAAAGLTRSVAARRCEASSPLFPNRL